jgi:adenylate cyclase
MTQEGFKRKLAAILSADAVGYSRLMAEDETATVKTMASYREIMSSLIKQHRGRVVDSPGDNVLAEFSSVVDAVQCAVAMQNEFQARNAKLPENRRMEFRIGINLGDVIDEEDRLYGDGVNIAARLESMADPGGICVSKTAFDQIETKLPLGYEYLGEQSVKNIPKPVGAYRVLMKPDAAGKVIGEKRFLGRFSRKTAVGAIIILVIVAIGLVSWNIYLQQPEKVESASVEQMAYPLPERPSIAVLPFDNLSNDSQQEYFSDGLTEEIITALSKVPKIFVIARESVFTYKGKPVEIKQVAEELGIQYVLKGSIRKSGDKIRITAQFIDSISGRHLWAERYDRELKEIFAVQDELTKKIITAMQVELTEGEQARVDAGGTNNLQAYLKFLQAIDNVNRLNVEGNALGKKLAQEAIDMDPNYAMAYRVLAAVHRMDVLLGISKSPKKSMGTCIKLLKKAIELDETYAEAYGALGFTLSLIGQHDKAIATAEKAVSLDPNSATTYAMLGHTFRMANRPKEAITSYTKSIRLNPLPPSFYLFGLGLSYSLDGQYEKGIEWCEKAVRENPDNFFARIILTAVYSMAGRYEEARTEGIEALRINPKYSLAKAEKRAKYKYKDKMFAALRKAGLPENPQLPLPDKPSIAVLAFDNLSGDPEQEYFSDSISENIITALSKVGELFVIARNSSFTYKGKPVKVQQISRELGVRYVLEGSVRRSGDRVRITAQLIDAVNGNHVWAENYDRSLDDLFEIQDEITLKIVNGLQIQLTEGEHARIWSKHNCSLDAYLKAAEAQSIRHKGTKESFIRYGQIGLEIVEAEPECLMGYSILVWYNAAIAPYTKSPKKFIEKAFKYAQKGLSIDDSDPSILRNAGLVYLHKREYEKAIDMGQRAVNMAPNGAEFHAMLGYILSYAEMPDKCIVHANQAIRLDPFPQVWPHATLGRCYLLKGQYDKSLEAYSKAVKISPDNTLALGGIIAAYSLLGREEDAHREAKRLLELMPGLNVAFLNGSPFKNQEDRNLFIDAWLKAGIPDKRQTAQQNKDN